jgi:hypothetical protein
VRTYALREDFVVQGFWDRQKPHPIVGNCAECVSPRPNKNQ